MMQLPLFLSIDLIANKLSVYIDVQLVFVSPIAFQPFVVAYLLGLIN